MTLNSCCNSALISKAFILRFSLLSYKMDRKLFPPFWRLQHSCKCQPYLRETCGSPANANRISVRFAGVPQMPTASPWDLRESRKRQPYLRGTCGSPANANCISVGLAGVPQMPTASPWDLRESRKCQLHLRETCGSPANAIFPSCSIVNHSCNASGALGGRGSSFFRGANIVM